MRLLGRLVPRTVTAQIAGLVVVSLLLTYAIALGFLALVRPEPPPRMTPDAEGSRIAMIAQLAQATRSQTALADLLEAARRAAIDVELVPVADLVRLDHATIPREMRFLRHRLQRAYGLDVIEDAQPPGGTPRSIVVRLHDERALAFRSLSGARLLQPPPPAKMLPARGAVIPAVFTFTIITVFIVLLSFYAVRWITRPLASIAAAANSFGRSLTGDPLSECGPREISQVARSLNEMRTRIRTLVDNRTRMLAAIGHDLRTPLTRLRLRAERLDEAPLRDSMLRELTTIDAMLDEALTYLRDDARSEKVSRVDLPSLLQTVCAEFADFGHAVSYSGPDHLAYPCRARALTRAVTNVVENGTKYGTEVRVSLGTLADGTVQIEVSDNGPGVPYSLREKAFDPFFKLDQARTTSDRTGFGLGLSIARDVVRAHAGDILLIEREPQGLRVRMLLPKDGGTMPESSESAQGDVRVPPTENVT